MDGRMDKSKISLDPYVCAFDHTKNCPIRTMFKLQPENLLGYCAICYINPINKQEAKIDMEMLSEHLPRFMDMYLKIRKEEKDQLMDIIKTLADSRRE
ncbi:unnamed protein product [marine sediment metagenome]|uniref:Uncharacterized protein n=1 Tax=marine sediment metagenome TaxID=412755 RepID=X1PDS3_9ZZZZ